MGRVCSAEHFWMVKCCGCGLTVWFCIMFPHGVTDGPTIRCRPCWAFMQEMISTRKWKQQPATRGSKDISAVDQAKQSPRYVVQLLLLHFHQYQLNLHHFPGACPWKHGQGPKEHCKHPTLLVEMQLWTHCRSGANTFSTFATQYERKHNRNFQNVNI